MKILVTGGTGFIGRALIKKLIADQHQVTVLTRSASKAFTLFKDTCLINEYLFDIPACQAPEAVVNLAGAPIADRRWSAKRKQLLRSSRIDFTRELVDWLTFHSPRLKVMISGSAIGYYGSQPPELVLSESSPVQDGFTHRLCLDWENEAKRMEMIGTRVCCLRTGIVLGKNGGALAKMLPAFRLGLGGPIASGQQMMSWVQLEDMVRAILFMLDNEQAQGPFNVTAPIAVSNRVFSESLAHALHRPACLVVPEFVINLMLGEGAELLVKGQNVIPTKLVEMGFSFQYPSLEMALKASL